MLRLNQTRN
ncbi:unnamed protein product [Linum tenue]|uniref:Uncharacterized protein n=1 Tax=Linum tenue TaxID=586396 RepID=A0AAV0P558_9ROSI|nr:unnamed protein product [Linum tenue]CAI0465767.1 unnamed protein product [Linum tenue]